MEKREQLARIIEAYGMEAQIDMALEEMSELAKALLKHRRAVKSGKKFDISLITDEIADVEIMCIQLEIIFKNAHEVEEQINFKINRQLAEWLKELKRLREQKPCDDAVSRQAVFEEIDDCSSDGLKGIFCSYDDAKRFKEYIKELPPVTPITVTDFADRCRECGARYGKLLNQKTRHCKDCKWWKDSDGIYRRGCGAESQCPINRREVLEGNGYCFLFEPQEEVISDTNMKMWEEIFEAESEG